MSVVLYLAASELIVDCPPVFDKKDCYVYPRI